jgi:hypothetical protein
MHFDTPFLKLPIQFDPETLERETRALPDSAWVPHPTGFKGNEAVRLISVNGGPNDAFDGPMRPTENLAQMPYVQQIMAELGGVWTRSRLMGLGAGAEVPTHLDAHYHWRTHIRIHVPVITDPRVLFTCDNETVHMAPGECWLFDSFRWHRVVNGWTQRRVHLVLDTVVTPALQQLVDQARSGTGEARYVAPNPDGPVELHFEQCNAPGVMTHWEMRCHLDFIFGHASDHPAMSVVRARMGRFTNAWAALWAEFGTAPEGIPAYRRLLGECRLDVMRTADDSVRLTNDYLLRDVIDSLIFGPALTPARTVGNIVSSSQRQMFA